MKNLIKWLLLVLLTVSAASHLAAAPVNDDFANALAIGGSTLIGSDLNATVEPDEPENGATNTVWWSWTASNSGLAFVDLNGSSGNYFVAVYTGSDVSSLTYVPGNPFIAVAGTTYYIQVSGDGGSIIAISVQAEGMYISDRRTKINPDNSENFSALVQVGNSGLSPTNIEIDVSVEGGYGATQTGILEYSTEYLPTNQLLAAYYVTNLLPGTQASVTISNICPAPKIIDPIDFGLGWDVFVTFKGSYQQTVFLVSGYWPQISGDTNDPVSRYDPPPTNATQAALQLVSGAINGPATVWENSSSNFSLSLNLSNGFVSTNIVFTNATWAVTPASPFSISEDGVFTAGAVLTDTTVTITADFVDSGVTNSISTNITVEVLPTPVIFSQPTNLALAFGQSATYTVTATGTAPLYYQWALNGVPLRGATNATLIIPSAEFTNEGSYTVTVNNFLGVAVSASATLSVTDTVRPTVTIANPNPATTYHTVNFTVALTGTATDEAGVIQVSYADNTNAYQIADGTTNWLGLVMLMPGTNLISVKSLNVAGLSSSLATVLVILDIAPNTDGIALLTNGDGTIQRAWPKKLIAGTSYTATAVPKANNLFSNWMGGTTYPYGVLSTSAKCKFAMASNLVLEANFVTNPFVALAGVYNGLFTNDSGISQQTAGMLKGLNVTAKGTYSGTLIINGASHVLSGSFNLALQATNIIPHTGLTVTMTLHQSSSNLTGSVSSEDSWVSALVAQRGANGGFAANYTLLIQPDSSAAPFSLSPGGDGYALISDKKGAAQITGALADGTAFVESTSVSLTGDIPIYASLYHNQGMLMGWVNLQSTNTTDAKLVWIHSSQGTKLFPAAFTSTNSVALSPWINPPPNSLLANLTQLQTFESLTEVNAFAITVNLDQRVSGTSGATSLSGTLAAKTGLLTITTGSGPTKAIGHGVVLQNTTTGGGYFLTTTNAGAIKIGE